MLPPRFEPYVFGFFLSGIMSLIISGISTFRAAGLAEGVFLLWVSAWLASWLVAFPAVLVVAPIARRIARRFIRYGG